MHAGLRLVPKILSVVRDLPVPPSAIIEPNALVTPLERVEAVLQIVLDLLQVLAQAVVRLLPLLHLPLLAHHLRHGVGHQNGGGVLRVLVELGLERLVVVFVAVLVDFEVVQVFAQVVPLALGHLHACLLQPQFVLLVYRQLNDLVIFLQPDLLR